MRRWVALGVSVVALMAAGPAWASTDSLSLSVAPGANDTPNGLSETATWNLGSPSDTYILDAHYQQGGSCAADPTNDPNAQALSLDGTGPLAPSGTVQASDQLLPGTYELCAWLDDQSTSTIIPASTNPLTVRVASADTIGLSLSPAPVEGRTIDVNASGVNYDRGALITLHQAAGPAGCGASPQTDSGAEVAADIPPGGTGQYTALLSNGSIFSRGSWRLCAWLTDQATGTVLAAAGQSFSVPGLGATLALHAPAAIANGSYTAFTFDITLPANIPVTAIVDVFDERHWTSCPAKPEDAPNATQPITQDVTSTSSATVHLNGNFSPPGSGAVLLCGWLEDAWSNAVPAPVVSGPVAASVTQVGNYKFHGQTAQHKPMAIFTTPFAGRILGVNFTARLHCNGTPKLTTGKRWKGVTHQGVSAIVFGIAKPDQHGRFAIRLTGNPNHAFTLAGRVSGHSITGTFTERGRSWVYTSNHAQNLSCTTGVVHFSLHRP